MESKTKELNSFLISQYNAMLNLTSLSTEDEMKTKIQGFSKINSIQEAKKYLKDTFNAIDGETSFIKDGVEFSIYENDKLFRICAEFNNEFICYEFSV